jgi:hypothetical protein
VSGKDCLGGPVTNEVITNTCTAPGAYPYAVKHGIWCKEEDIYSVSERFHPGQTVTGDDIKRALEEGWVATANNGRSKLWSEKGTFYIKHGVADSQSFFNPWNPCSDFPCTLLRKQEPEKEPEYPTTKAIPQVGTTKHLYVSSSVKKTMDKWMDEWYERNDNPNKGAEMEKPKTNAEKTACAEARKEVIKDDIEAKKKRYKASMQAFIAAEEGARRSRKEADELRDKLGVSDTEMKELFD